MYVIQKCIILNNLDFIISPKLNGLYAGPFASFESNVDYIDGMYSYRSTKHF